MSLLQQLSKLRESEKTTLASQQAKKEKGIMAPAALPRNTIQEEADQTTANTTSTQQHAVEGEEEVEYGFIPSTTGLQQGFLQRYRPSGTFKLVTNNYHLQDALGGTIARLAKGVFTPSLIRVLFSSTLDLEHEMPPERPQVQHERGDFHTHHFGYWRKYQPKIYEISKTSTKAAKTWIAKNQPLFKVLKEYVQQRYPALYALYNSVETPGEKYFEPFCAVAINFNVASTPHYDENDFPEGNCFVVPFGDYTEGAELMLEEVMTEVRAKPGDLVHFASSKLKHSNRPFNKNRYSLVFFTHANCFHSNLIDTKIAKKKRKHAEISSKSDKNLERKGQSSSSSPQTKKLRQTSLTAFF